MSMDERPFNLNEIRNHRNDERQHDVTCEECGGSGITCPDPYGFGRESVCGSCDGSGGWEGTASCPDCDDELGEMDHCESCEVDVNPVFR